MQIPEELPPDQTPPIWYKFRNLVFSQQFDEAARLLDETPELVSMTNSCGETALHFLAIENDLQGVAWLHGRGLALDTSDAFGEPLIFSVAQLGYKELFRWFVRQGADLNVVNMDGLNLISHLREYEKNDMADWIATGFL
jgi:hypothetical protein